MADGCYDGDETVVVHPERATVVSTLVVAFMLLVATVPVGASQSTSTSKGGSIAGADTSIPPSSPESGHTCSDDGKISVSDVEVSNHEEENERFRDRKRLTISATGQSVSSKSQGHHHDFEPTEVGFDTATQTNLVVRTKSGVLPYADDELFDGLSEVFYFRDPGRFHVKSIHLAIVGQTTHRGGGPNHDGTVTQTYDSCTVLFEPPLTVEVGQCQPEKTSLVLQHGKLSALATQIDVNHRAVDAAMKKYYRGKVSAAVGETMMVVGSYLSSENGGTNLFLAGSRRSVAGTGAANAANVDFQNAQIAEIRASQEYLDTLIEYKSARRYVRECHNYEMPDGTSSPPRPDTWEQGND